MALTEAREMMRQLMGCPAGPPLHTEEGEHRIRLTPAG